MTLLLVDSLLFLCLLSAPLMYASMDLWARLPLALVSLAALNLALAARPRAAGALWRLPWVWLGSGMLVLVLFQLIPFPAAFIQKVSPAAFAFYSQYLPGGGSAGQKLTFSLYPSDTLDGLIQFLTYAAVFLTVLIRLYPSGDATAREPHPVSLRKAPYLMLGCLLGVLSLIFHSLYDFNLHITANGIYFVTLLALGTGAACFNGYDHSFFRRTVNLIIQFGFALAVFAVVQKFSYNGHIYWIGMPAPTPVGPYFNYDHYAGFMEMCGALAMSRLVASIFHTSFVQRKGLVKKFLWFSTAEANTALRTLFMTTVIVATIFMSASRGGIMSFVLSMLIFFLLIILAGWRAGKAGRVTVLITVICLLIGVMVLWLGPEPFLKRFHLITIDKIIKMEGPIGERMLFYKETLPIIKDFSWVGTGLGTFGANFSRYRSFGHILDYLRHTHNDYLELVSETGAGGVVFLLVFFGLYIAYFRRVVRKLE